MGLSLPACVVGMAPHPACALFCAQLSVLRVKQERVLGVSLELLLRKGTEGLGGEEGGRRDWPSQSQAPAGFQTLHQAPEP